MNHEEQLEALLTQALPDTPPEEILHTVTPWRRAMRRILMGLALNMITLRFLLLQYLLPLAGSILLVLGFRTLRRENRWLRRGWQLSLGLLCLQVLSLWINGIVWQEREDVLLCMTIVHMCLQLLQLFCLWQGLRAVQQKTGLPGKSGSAGALLLWYGILCALALLEVSGWLAMIPLLLSYFLILRSLHKLSQSLEEAGYAIVPSPSSLSDKTVAAIAAGMAAVGLLLCLLFLGKYTMHWQVQDTSPGAAAEAIAAQLKALGFPEDLLSDLTEEDLLLCADAQEIVIQQEEYPINDGKTVVVQEEDQQIHTSVYDVHELQITHVALRFDGERTRWRIFHSFRWTEDASFPGTEVMQLWTAGRSSEGWMDFSSITGRVLCKVNGQRCWADYAFLGRKNYTSQSIFWGSQSQSDPFAAFSFPKNASECRGYLTYEIAELEYGWLVDSWVNYVHQISLWQYPVLSAMEARMQGKTGRSSAFRMVQTALQFNPMYPQEALE